MELLTIGNTKTLKGDKRGYLTGILHLMPDAEICPHASKGCMTSCLQSSGRGRFDSVKNARIRKRGEFKANRVEFMRLLIRDIKALERKAKRENKIPVVRLNVAIHTLFRHFKYTSDISYVKGFL